MDVEVEADKAIFEDDDDEEEYWGSSSVPLATEDPSPALDDTEEEEREVVVVEKEEEDEDPLIPSPLLVGAFSIEKETARGHHRPASSFPCFGPLFVDGRDPLSPTSVADTHGRIACSDIKAADAEAVVAEAAAAAARFLSVNAHRDVVPSSPHAERKDI